MRKGSVAWLPQSALARARRRALSTCLRGFAISRPFLLAIRVFPPTNLPPPPFALVWPLTCAATGSPPLRCESIILARCSASYAATLPLHWAVPSLPFSGTLVPVRTFFGGSSGYRRSRISRIARRGRADSTRCPPPASAGGKPLIPSYASLRPLGIFHPLRLGRISEGSTSNPGPGRTASTLSPN